MCGALAGVRRLVVLEEAGCARAAVGQRLAALLLERGAAPEKLRLLNAGERLPAQGSVRQLYHALGLDAQGVVCAVKEVLSSSEKTRLDVLLVEQGLLDSRQKAQALIMAGLVLRQRPAGGQARDGRGQRCANRCGATPSPMSAAAA